MGMKYVTEMKKTEQPPGCPEICEMGTDIDHSLSVESFAVIPFSISSIMWEKNFSVMQ